MSAKTDEVDEPYMNYEFILFDENVQIQLIEGALTNSTGLNRILQDVLGMNQYYRRIFMTELIDKGFIERIAERESKYPYTISVRRVTMEESLTAERKTIALSLRTPQESTIPSDPNEVMLLVCTPDEPLLINHIPEWFFNKINAGYIKTVSALDIDGSNLTYLYVYNNGTETLCKTTQIIGQHGNGELYVRNGLVHISPNPIEGEHHG